MTNDQIRENFENRYRQSLSPVHKNFERTLRGVYKADFLQHMWEGFYAASEDAQARIAELEDDLQTVRSSLNFRNLTAISRADRLDKKDELIQSLESKLKIATDLLRCECDEINPRHHPCDVCKALNEIGY